MKQEISCLWQQNFKFESTINGHSLVIDLDESAGGNNEGPPPKPLLLVSLAGCTGVDVIMILKKMRIEPSWFNIRVEGKLNDEQPSYYGRITIIYEFKAADGLDQSKVEKAVKLSEEKYCGVSAMLGKAASIEFKTVYL